VLASFIFYLQGYLSCYVLQNSDAITVFEYSSTLIRRFVAHDNHMFAKSKA